MEKYFKLSLSISAIVVAISVTYYFVLFPNINRREMKEVCMEMGQKYQNTYVNQAGGNKKYFDDSQYGYSQALDTCVFSGGYSYDEELGGEWERFVKDLYTNNNVISLYHPKENINEQWGDWATEYWEEHAQIFGDKK